MVSAAAKYTQESQVKGVKKDRTNATFQSNDVNSPLLMFTKFAAII